MIDAPPQPNVGSRTRSYGSDRTTLRTPEGVGFEVTIAGLGSRAFGALIDAVVQTILVVIVSSASQGSFQEGGFGSAIVVVLVFVLIFCYFFICETLFRGRTLGKRMTGLRVMNDQGAPASARQIMVRNLVRIVDFLPFFYIVGIVGILTSNRSQRIGDLAAGTIVIVEPASVRKRNKSAKKRQVQFTNALPGPIGVPTPKPLSDDFSVELSDAARDELATWDVIGVTRSDVAIVRQFLARRNSLTPAARNKIADDFAAKLRPRVQGVHPTLSNERFLELLVEAKQLKR